MATITSAQTGLASSPSTWVGGVVPVAGDKVIINAGHTVTLDGTFHWGDDTNLGINVTGTLKVSRTVSSQLTVRGDLFINQTVGGFLDIGSEADPIPSNVTFTLILNNSTTMAHNKWGLRTNEAASVAWTGGLSIWGAYKKPYAFLTVAPGSSDTVVTVDNATGWRVGDILGFQPPSATAVIFRTITAITPGSGTTAAVTIGASLGRAGAIGNGVINITRNVKITSDQATTYRSHISLRIGYATTGSNKIEIGPCTITLTGGNTSTWQMAGLNIHREQNTTVNTLIRKIAGPVVTNVLSVSGSTVTTAITGVGINFFTGQASPTYAEAIYVAFTASTGTAIQLYNGTSTSIGPESVLFGGSVGMNCGFSQGPVACKYSGRLWGIPQPLAGSGISLDLSDVIIDGWGRWSTTAFGSIIINNAKIGLNAGPFTLKDSLNFGTACLAPTTILNPSYIPSAFGVSRANSNLLNAHPSNYLDILQINGDPTVNERYVKGGKVSRDPTRTKRSTASICLASWYSVNKLIMPLVTKVVTGDTLHIKGSIWIESTYLPGDAPTITLSGNGLVTTNWTCPAVANQWNDFDLSIVNTNSYPTDVTITLTARSNANTETARIWVDGIFSDPWTGNIRHFGYQWLPQTNLISDSRVTLTEAQAAALPVVVDHTNQTITVTGQLTPREVFEACLYDLVKTENQSKAVHISSSTGETFSTSYRVIQQGSGNITGIFTDIDGTHVTINSPTVLSGSRVQLYNVSTGQELYNNVLSSNGFSYSTLWFVDQTIRLRVSKEDMLPVEAIGILSQSGLVYLVEQTFATVYAENGIIGSTCTEFSPDASNLQVDLNDPDGVTTVQRVYAWLQWYQTTQEGIASNFFNSITAGDYLNYLVDSDRVDLKFDNTSSLPVVISGGYISRKDGASVIAASSGSIQMDPGKAYIVNTANLLKGVAKETTVQSVLGAIVSRK